MTREGKLNSIAVCILAGLFYWLFMFAKHNAYLRSVIPFGDDPYDSVGSFACVVGALLALVSMARAFYPYRGGPGRLQLLYLVRSQLAVVLAVFLTAAADLTAMARYPWQWYPSFWGDGVIAVVVVLAVSGGAIIQLLRPSLPATAEERRGRVVRALLATVACMLLLAAYPASMLVGTTTHLLAIVLGAVALFAPMRLWLLALAPDEPSVEGDSAHRRGARGGVWRRWGAAAAVGLMVGACAFAGEMAEHVSGLPMRRMLFVGSVFAGIGLSGILIAYVFLGEPLGFATRR